MPKASDLYAEGAHLIAVVVLNRVLSADNGTGLALALVGPFAHNISHNVLKMVGFTESYRTPMGSLQIIGTTVAASLAIFMLTGLSLYFVNSPLGDQPLLNASIVIAGGAAARAARVMYL